MRSPPFDMALRIGAVRHLTPEEELVDRIRMVLDTQPGQMPWAPEFGCDLSGFTNRALSAEQLSDAQAQIEDALSRWVPDARIVSVVTRMVENVAVAPGSRGAPLAEAAMASRSIAATLSVQVLVETRSGPLTLEATLNP